MRNMKPSYPFHMKLMALAILFIAMFTASMIFGAADISVKDVWYALATSRTGDRLNIIREIRLPRELAAILVGSALAISGAVMQGMTRNPLADPGLLGLTAGANAALAFAVAFFPGIGYMGIIMACFAGAALGASLVFGVSSMKRGGFSPFRIVLAGAAISSFLFAIGEGVGIFFRVSKDISMWTAGGLVGTSWTQLQLISPFIGAGILIAFMLSRQLTILSLSEELAVGLGQKTTQVKVILFLVIILLTGASVALVGNMAFIGLIIPHMARPLVGQDYRHILPASAFLGATMMLFADTMGRTLNAPFETPVAAIIALIALPFFLIILRKGGRQSA